MSQLFITLAAILGGLSVAAVAFATHALKTTLDLLRELGSESKFKVEDGCN